MALLYVLEKKDKLFNMIIKFLETCDRILNFFICLNYIHILYYFLKDIISTTCNFLRIYTLNLKKTTHRN